MKTNGKKPMWMETASRTRLAVACVAATCLVGVVSSWFPANEPIAGSPPETLVTSSLMDGPVAGSDDGNWSEPLGDVPPASPNDSGAEVSAESNEALDAPQPPTAISLPETASPPVVDEEAEKRRRYRARVEELNIGLRTIRTANLEVCQQEVDAIRALFAGFSGQVPEFAERALGLGSKVQLATGFVKGSAAHREHLAEAFAEIISAELIERLTAQVDQRLREGFPATDNDFFVQLRLDVPDAEMPAPNLTLEREAIRRAFERILDASVAASKEDVVISAGKELIDGAISGAISKRITDAAGMTSEQEGFTLGNFLLGLAINVGVEAATSGIYDAAVNPVGELKELIATELSNIECLMLCGSDGNGGLINQLLDYERRYADARLRRIEAAFAAEQ
jgi:hypothetical protein